MLQSIILRDPVLVKWLVFLTRSDVLLAHRPDEVLPVLREIERRVNEEDLFAAGFVSYEAAPGRSTRARNQSIDSISWLRLSGSFGVEGASGF
jgi:para-aminobenzoate synthetase/4-amino-4-deoxychorismate lyase